MREAVASFFTQTIGLANPLFWIAMACAFGLGKARQPAYSALLIGSGW